MSFIGDLERLFATSLYPLRVPIAIGMLVALVVLVLVARRRGWFAAARRHPARTTVLVVALLAVGLPIGWYLGSPLFIRTSLVEAAPSAPAPPAVGPSPADAGTPGPRSGSFVGADEFHFGSGTAQLLETAPGQWIVRFEDFSVRNGPDLYVYLSPDPAGYAVGAVELGTLKATDGSFNTDVPAGTDVAAIRSVVIWCKQFGVQFAVASLSG
ncbi:MAG: DM13 domain-containing protein [Chloroflexi bacterium]|nr:DM13 domain-containing protein [Chloroflexota bacterium]